VSNFGAGYRIFYKGDVLKYTNKGSFQPLIKGSQRFNIGKRKADDFLYSSYELVVETIGLTPPTSTFNVAIQGGSGSGAVAAVSRYSNGALTWGLANGGTGYKQGDQVFMQPSGYGPIYMTASIPINSYLEDNLNRFDAIADYKVYDGESMSHESEP